MSSSGRVSRVKKYSIRSVLLGTFSFATLIPLVLFGVTLYIILSRNISTKIYDDNIALARLVGREINNFLIDAGNSVQLLAEIIGEEENRGGEIQKNLDTALKRYSSFENLLVLDERGTVTAASPFNQDTLGSNFSTQNYFKEIEKNETLAWSAPFISSVSRDPTVAVGCRSGNETLVANLNLRRLTAVASEMVTEGNWKVIVTDENGTILAHPKKIPAIRQMNIGNTEAVRKTLENRGGIFRMNFEGEEVLCATSFIPATKWAVLVMRSVRDAFLLRRQTAFLLASSLLGAFLLGLLLSAFSRRMILTPIDSLLTAADRIGRGEYHIKIEPSFRELNILADSFQQMTGQIEKREGELKSSIQEKEILLKELHHRVKNNLQIITSLLSLKYNSLPKSQEKQILFESMAHIYSIAQVHEQLYLSGKLTKIDFQDYLESLAGYLIQSIDAGKEFPRLDIGTQGVFLTMEKAIPCGLIAMELLSNALYHAFPEGGGEISIHCEEYRGEVRVEVQDNGIGFDAKKFTAAETLGFQLIHILTSQLEGRISYFPRDGSRFELVFHQ